MEQHVHPTGDVPSGSLLEVFTPRQVCMNFESDVIALHLVSDALIALAYFSIPFALVTFVRRRKDSSFNWVFWLFALFIVLCGTTHLFDIVAIWSPVYRLDGCVKAATAVASLGTAFCLWRILPAALAIPSVESLQRANEALAAEVAQRKHAEEQLASMNTLLEQRVRQRTTELESLLVSAPLGIAVFDRAYRYLRVNSVLAGINGLAAEDHENRTVAEVVPANASAVEPVIERVFVTGNAIANLEIEGETSQQPGVRRHWLTGFYPIRGGADEQVTAVGAWVVEISDLKRAERELRDSEHRFRAVAEAVPGQLWTATPNGDVDFVGPLLSRFTGCPAQALAGWGWTSVIHEEDKAPVVAAWQRALESGESYSVDLRIRSSDGSYRWFRTQASCQRNDSGRIERWFGYSSDVESIKAAEENLRRSERRERERAEELAAIMRTVPAAVWISQDAHCETIIGNPGSYRLTRMAEGENASASASDPSRRQFREFRNGQPLSASELPMQVAAREGRDVFGVELDLVFDDGAVRYIYGGASPLRDGAGKARGAVGSFIDITELKEATDALRVRQRELQALADNSPDVLSRLDRNLKHVFVNHAAARATGLQVSDIIGKTIHELGLPASDCNRLEEAVSDVFESGKSHTLELMYAGPRGDRSYVTRLVPEREPDGTVTHVLAVTTDITEQRQAEREARKRASEAEEAKRILQGIMDHVPEGIAVTIDREASIRMVSRYGAALIGRPPEALVGTLEFARPEAWNLRRPDAEGRPAAHDLPLSRAVLQGENVVNEEWLIERDDGMAIPISCNAGPIRDASGTIIGGVIAFRDITVLRMALSELRESNRRKDEFLATLAHELRNPLAPLRSGLDVLSLDPPPGSKRVLTMMTRQLGQMVHLIDDLMDVSRITSGKVVLRRELVSLQSITDIALESARPAIDGAKHSLEVVAPDSPIWVDGDVTRLAQVVGNLLNNASKYTPPGGKISVELESRDDRALLHVSDNGIGIPAEMLGHVFDMFAQVNRNLHRSQGGLGIGLALVKRLVEMHGGTISVQSAGVNRGSTFTVCLHLASAVGASAAEPNVVTLDAAPLRVLVVDDNRDAAESLAMFLEHRGYVVSTAFDGPSALNKAAEAVPDVAILDLGMPGMSGHDLARELARRFASPPLLVALTGWASALDREVTQAAGFQHHLTKPVDSTLLLHLLSETAARLSQRLPESA